jgi:hypothetical protein
MDDSMTPDFGFPVENPLANTLTWNEGASEWINASTYVAKYDVADNEETLEDIDVSIDDLTDFVGNLQVDIAVADHFDINTFTVGVQETDLSLMSVFPNPVTSGSDVTVVLENMPQVVTLQVYNLNGQVMIAQREVQTENDRIIVSTANMAAGMYFVHIHSDEGQVVMQLEVQ